jgi:hypothetical protein
MLHEQIGAMPRWRLVGAASSTVPATLKPSSIGVMKKPRSAGLTGRSKRTLSGASTT